MFHQILIQGDGDADLHRPPCGIAKGGQRSSPLDLQLAELIFLSHSLESPCVSPAVLVLVPLELHRVCIACTGSLGKGLDRSPWQSWRGAPGLTNPGRMGAEKRCRERRERASRAPRLAEGALGPAYKG